MASTHMAAAPVKSQPLHNFSLSFLKWGNKNQMNNHRCRRPVDPPPPPDHRSSASSEPDSDGGGFYRNDSEPENHRKPPLVGSRTSRNRFAFNSCSLNEKSPKQVLERESTEVDDEEREKGDEVEESSVQKPWNLRPRRSVLKSGAIEIGGSSRNGELQEIVPAVQQSDNNMPKSLRLRGFAESHGMERKEKLKFWISLSREEIEEDIFVMTGSKPARRPKKRPKTVQKQLDNVFPGLWLVGVTADAYRVPEAPAKRLPCIAGGQSSKHVVSLEILYQCRNSFGGTACFLCVLEEVKNTSIQFSFVKRNPR